MKGPLSIGTILLALALGGCRRAPEPPSFLPLYVAEGSTHYVIQNEIRGCAEMQPGDARITTVELPPGARLELSYGIYKYYWRRLRRKVDIEVEVRSDAAAATGPVTYSAELPREERGDRYGWQHDAMDLSSFGRGPVSIETRITVAEGRGPLLREKPEESLSVCVSPLLVATTMPRDPPPRVLVIVLDTLRADQLGTYGSEPSPSPFIDELARRGTVFENAFSQANWTLPGFGSIFTGLYPGNHGMANTKKLPADTPTMVQLFRDGDFLTAGFHGGGFLNARFGWAGSFHLYRKLRGVEEHGTVTDWMNAHAAVPTLTLLHSYDVHAPYDDAPDFYRERLRRDTYVPREYLVRNPDPHVVPAPYHPADLAYLLDLYRSQIAWVDTGLRELFDELGGWALLDDTVVILLADHGEAFGEHGTLLHGGSNLHRELTHTPMILAGPGIAAGRRLTVPVENIDVLPTLVEWFGLDAAASERMDGASFADLLRATSRPDDPSRRREIAVSQSRSGFTVRSERWELHTGEGDDVLIDLRADPDGARNVAPENRDLVDRLRAEATTRTRLLSMPETDEPEDYDPAVRRELKALGYLD